MSAPPNWLGRERPRVRTQGSFPSFESSRRSNGQVESVPWLVPQVRTIGLTLLIVATCLAVASVSIWLVLPYLVLMAWLLLAPATPSATGVRTSSADQAVETSQTVTEAEDPAVAGLEKPTARTRTKARAAAVEGTTPTDPSGLAPEATNAVASVTEAPAKPRRGRGGRGRGKKATAAATPDPVDVKWVRVGPGQFVRVEEPRPAPTGGESPVESTPSPLPTDTAAPTEADRPATPEPAEPPPQQAEGPELECREPKADDATGPGASPELVRPGEPEPEPVLEPSSGTESTSLTRPVEEPEPVTSESVRVESEPSPSLTGSGHVSAEIVTDWLAPTEAPSVTPEVTATPSLDNTSDLSTGTAVVAPSLDSWVVESGGLPGVVVEPQPDWAEGFGAIASGQAGPADVDSPGVLNDNLAEPVMVAEVEPPIVEPVGTDPAGEEDVPSGLVVSPEVGDVVEPAVAPSAGSDLPQAEEWIEPEAREADSSVEEAIEEPEPPTAFDGESPPVPATIDRPPEPPTVRVEHELPLGEEVAPSGTIEPAIPPTAGAEPAPTPSGLRRLRRSWPSDRPRRPALPRRRRPDLRARRPSRTRGRPSRGPRRSPGRLARTRRTFEPRAPPASRPRRMALRPRSRSDLGSIGRFRPEPRRSPGRVGSR